jgi:DNA-binding transcriptional LysR family regulator
MNITLKQIRAFATVARERSFTRASERLHLTQSTLTTSIKILESEIGMRLFDRSTRSVVLTAQGTSFLPVAERMLRDLHDSLEDLRMTADRQRGSVTVAAAPSFINYVVAPAVAWMASAYPGISVRLAEETTEGVTRMVLGGEADFGVITLFQPVPTLDASLVLSDVYGAVYRAGHPLDDEAAPLSWTRLTGHTLVALAGANGIRALVDRHPKIPPGFKNPAYEVGSMSSLRSLLELGFCYTMLPSLAARPLVADGLCYRPLSKPVVRRHLYAVKKKGRTLSPSALALLESMTESLGRIDGDANLKIVFTPREMQAFCTG